MNELHFAYKIRQNLNRGLQQMSVETLKRLEEARENALVCQKRVESRSALAAAGHFIIDHVENLSYKQVALSFALLLGMAASTFWMADRRVNEMGAIDSAILASDLPVRAFTDKGFDAWLKHSSQH